jgi:hypothetical protein
MHILSISFFCCEERSFFKTCIACFSLRRWEVWIQRLNHRATTTKQAEKVTSLEKKDYKLSWQRKTIPTKPAWPHQWLHPVGLGRRPGLHKHYDGKASTKKTCGQASTRGPSLQPQTTSPSRIGTSTGSPKIHTATAKHLPGNGWKSIHPRTKPPHLQTTYPVGLGYRPTQYHDYKASIRQTVANHPPEDKTSNLGWLHPVGLARRSGLHNTTIGKHLPETGSQAST